MATLVVQVGSTDLKIPNRGSNRLLVLMCFSCLPNLMTIVQLLKPARAFVVSSTRQSQHDRRSRPAQDSGLGSGAAEPSRSVVLAMHQY